MSANSINNHMVWAIVSVFMFWPTAIPAILHALKVNKAVERGNDALALQESAAAKKWCKITLFICIGLIVLSVVGVFIAVCCVSNMY